MTRAIVTGSGKLRIDTDRVMRVALRLERPRGGGGQGSASRAQLEGTADAGPGHLPKPARGRRAKGLPVVAHDQALVDRRQDRSGELSQLETPLCQPRLSLIVELVPIWPKRRRKVGAKTCRSRRSGRGNEQGNQTGQGLDCGYPRTRGPLLPLLGQPTSSPNMRPHLVG